VPNGEEDRGGRGKTETGKGNLSCAFVLLPERGGEWIGQFRSQEKNASLRASPSRGKKRDKERTRVKQIHKQGHPHLQGKGGENRSKDKLETTRTRRGRSKTKRDRRNKFSTI